MQFLILHMSFLTHLESEVVLCNNFSAHLEWTAEWVKSYAGWWSIQLHGRQMHEEDFVSLLIPWVFWRTGVPACQVGLTSFSGHATASVKNDNWIPSYNIAAHFAVKLSSFTEKRFCD